MQRDCKKKSLGSNEIKRVLKFVTLLSFFITAPSIYSSEEVSTTKSASKKNYKYKGLSRPERIKKRLEEAKFRKPTDNESYFETKGRGEQVDSIRQKNLSFFIWNIQKNVKSWRDSLEKWQGQSDFTLLQEFNYTNEFKEFLKKSRPFQFATAYVYKEEKHLTGVAISSKVKPAKKKVLYSNYKEPIIRMPKVTQFQWYKVKNKKEKLLIVNIHAINFVPTNLFIDQMVHVENVIREHQGAVVFAGDFNTWSFELTKYMKKMMERLNLSPVYFKPDHRKRFRGYPLDHAFVRGGKIENAKVIRLEKASDHNGLYFEIILD